MKRFVPGHPYQVLEIEEAISLRAASLKGFDSNLKVA
jgi:hypothetical protein